MPSGNARSYEIVSKNGDGQSYKVNVLSGPNAGQTTNLQYYDNIQRGVVESTPPQTSAPAAPATPNVDVVAEPPTPTGTGNTFGEYHPGKLTIVPYYGTKEGRSERYAVYDEHGNQVGEFYSSAGYHDTPIKPGSKIVNRKNITNWNFRIDPAFAKSQGWEKDPNTPSRFSAGYAKDDKKRILEEMYTLLDSPNVNDYVKGETGPKDYKPATPFSYSQKSKAPSNADSGFKSPQLALTQQTYKPTGATTTAPETKAPEAPVVEKPGKNEGLAQFSTVPKAAPLPTITPGTTPQHIGGMVNVEDLPPDEAKPDFGGHSQKQKYANETVMNKWLKSDEVSLDMHGYLVEKGPGNTSFIQDGDEFHELNAAQLRKFAKTGEIPGANDPGIPESGGGDEGGAASPFTNYKPGKFTLVLTEGGEGSNWSTFEVHDQTGDVVGKIRAGKDKSGSTRWGYTIDPAWAKSKGITALPDNLRAKYPPKSKADAAKEMWRKLNSDDPNLDKINMDTTGFAMTTKGELPKKLQDQGPAIVEKAKSSLFDKLMKVGNEPPPLPQAPAGAAPESPPTLTPAVSPPDHLNPAARKLWDDTLAKVSADKRDNFAVSKDFVEAQYGPEVRAEVEEMLSWHSQHESFQKAGDDRIEAALADPSSQAGAALRDLSALEQTVARKSHDDAVARYNAGKGAQRRKQLDEPDAFSINGPDGPSIRGPSVKNLPSGKPPASLYTEDEKELLLGDYRFMDLASEVGFSRGGKSSDRALEPWTTIKGGTGGSTKYGETERVTIDELASRGYVPLAGITGYVGAPGEGEVLFWNPNKVTAAAPDVPSAELPEASVAVSKTSPELVPPPTPHKPLSSGQQKLADSINKKTANLSTDDPFTRATQLDAIIAGLRWSAIDTDKVYAGQSHSYTKERHAVHEAMYQELLSSVETAGIPKDRDALVLGGLPGSGKSYALRPGQTAEEFGVVSMEMNKPAPPGATHVVMNPDTVKDMMISRGMLPPGLSSDLKPNEQVNFLHSESNYLAKMFQDRLSDAGYNVVIDRTFESTGAMDRAMVPMARRGYRFRALFVDIPIPESRQATMKRYTDAALTPMGGRFIPSSVQGNRASSKGNLSKNRDAFDSFVAQDWFEEYMILDNTGVVNSTPKGIVQKGTGNGTGASKYYPQNDTTAAPPPPTVAGASRDNRRRWPAATIDYTHGRPRVTAVR